jgi:hypothetical protein
LLEEKVGKGENIFDLVAKVRKALFCKGSCAKLLPKYEYCKNSLKVRPDLSTWSKGRKIESIDQ